MFDRLVEQFCEFDDFDQSVRAQHKATLLTDGTVERRHGPEGGLVDSEIMTIVVMYHGSRFQDFKAFYNNLIRGYFRAFFPGAPCYERFLTLTKRVWILLTIFLVSRMGRKTDIYYIDSTALPVCHTKRHAKHRVFKGLATWGRTSVGWFFGFKLHLVFNNQRQIVALRLTPGNINDPVPVSQLTKDLVGKDLVGKLFGDKGYIAKKLAQELLRRGLKLITKSKKGMPPLKLSAIDQALLDGRSIAETIIGHIKEFSSLRMPKHRCVPNAFTHLIAALVAYQTDPLAPKQRLELTAPNP
jgi:hypothetical protein